MTRLVTTLCLTFLCFFVKANNDDSTKIKETLQQIADIESKLSYKTGTIDLGNGLATLIVPAGYKYLGSKDAQYIVEEVWGNLKGDAPLGMIIPEDQMASIADYAFIVEYNDMGYVKDEDADKMNYDDVLKSIKEDQSIANEERKKLGMPGMHIMGWAEKPYYDKNKKILYWAKEFSVDGSDENTLNYDIRILGRKGVLVLQAVSSMVSIDSVNKNKDAILNMVSFNDGNKYSDYNSTTDKVAAWTIGGLVAGKVLAKVGFFGVILKFLKFIILGVVAAGGMIWRYITGRRKKEEEQLAYEPAPENDQAS